MTPQPAAKQRLLALVADLDKATNIMVVKTWSVRGIANTLRHIANGLPVETSAKPPRDADSSLEEPRVCNKPNMNTQPGGLSANSPGFSKS
jgi:hypothetical protein